MADPTPSTFLQALRVLSSALMASMIIVLALVTFALAGKADGAPPIWAFGVIAAVVAGGATFINLVGYRFTPIAPGTAEDEARRSSVSQVQTLTILRFALAEAVALISIALAFGVEGGGAYLCVAGVLAAEVLMFWHVWPSERLITRVQEALEVEEGRSYLREALNSSVPSRRG